MFMIIFSLLPGNLVSVVEAKTRVLKTASYKNTQHTQNRKNNNVMKFLEREPKDTNETKAEQSNLDKILALTKNYFDIFILPFKVFFTYLKNMRQASFF